MCLGISGVASNKYRVASVWAVGNTTELAIQTKLLRRRKLEDSEARVFVLMFTLCVSVNATSKNTVSYRILPHC